MRIIKYVLLVLIFAIFLTAVACEKTGKNHETSLATQGAELPDEELMISEMTFEQVVEQSNVAIRAEYLETTVHNNYAEHVFSVKGVLYGKADQETVCVPASSEESFYERGKDYILILYKSESILGEGGVYINVASRLLLNESDGIYTLYGETISFAPYETLTDYLSSVSVEVASDEVNDVQSYESVEQELALASEFIAEILIEDLFFEGMVHNGNTYICKINETIKGNITDKQEDGTILVVIKKNTVEIGKTYVVGFTQADEHSVIYSQSVDGGVYEVGDERIQTVKGYLQ